MPPDNCLLAKASQQNHYCCDSGINTRLPISVSSTKRPEHCCHFAFTNTPPDNYILAKANQQDTAVTSQQALSTLPGLFVVNASCPVFGLTKKLSGAHV